MERQFVLDHGVLPNLQSSRFEVTSYCLNPTIISYIIDGDVHDEMDPSGQGEEGPFRHPSGRELPERLGGFFSLKPIDGSKTLTDVQRKRFSLLWHSNGEIVTPRPGFPTSGQA